MTNKITPNAKLGGQRAFQADFLGQGWCFPIVFEDPDWVSGDADIQQSLLIILQTSPGERLMLPEFGCRLNELVFAAQNSPVTGLAETFVKQAIDSWEPRVLLQKVTAEFSATQPMCLEISLDYVVRKKNTPANLVYPFYLR